MVIAEIACEACAKNSMHRYKITKEVVVEERNKREIGIEKNYSKKEKHKSQNSVSGCG